jgi:hypothetical protein
MTDHSQPHVRPRAVLPQKAGRRENSTDENTAYERRLRKLEAEAFRTTRTLIEHSEKPASIYNQQDIAFGGTGLPRKRAVSHQLDTMESRLDAIEKILFALAHTQGIDLKIID